MANEYYYYENNIKLGPYEAAVIKQLAKQGQIKPDTIIECNGKRATARAYKMEFPTAAVPIPKPAEPQPLPQSVPVAAPSQATGNPPANDPPFAPLPSATPGRPSNKDVLKEFPTINILIVITDILAGLNILAAVVALIATLPDHVVPVGLPILFGAIVIKVLQKIMSEVLILICRIEINTRNQHFI